MCTCHARQSPLSQDQGHAQCSGALKGGPRHAISSLVRVNDLETAPIASSDGNGRRKEGPGPGEKRRTHVGSIGSFCGLAKRAGGYLRRN